MTTVNRLWSYALRENLTARGLVSTVYHHLDATTREHILAESCKLYYGYAPRSSGSVVLPPEFVHMHDHIVLPAGTLIDSTGAVVVWEGHLVRLSDRTFAAEDIETLVRWSSCRPSSQPCVSPCACRGLHRASSGSMLSGFHVGRLYCDAGWSPYPA